MSRKIFHVSGWSLRRKLALVLAVPMLFAATFGSLRVHKELAESADHSSAASQVTVLPPAVDYLNAAETAAVVARKRTASSTGCATRPSRTWTPRPRSSRRPPTMPT